MKKKKLLIKIILFIIPFVLFFTIMEIGLSNVQNMYSIKADILNSQKDNAEILVLGASQSQRAFNPEFFSNNVLNMANNTQSIYLDTHIAEEYMNKMPKLNGVIFNLMPPVMEWNDGGESTDRLRFYYAIYYGLDYEKWTDNFDIQNISKIFMFGYSESIEYAMKGFDVKLDGGGEYTLKGFYTDSSSTMELNPDTDYREQAQMYINGFKKELSDKNFENNKKNIEKTIVKLKDSGVTPIFVITPVMKEYASINDDCYKKTLEFIQEMNQKYDVKYFDYFSNSEFGSKDFFDVSHLNEKGSVKFSKMLDTDIASMIR